MNKMKIMWEDFRETNVYRGLKELIFLLFSSFGVGFIFLALGYFLGITGIEPGIPILNLIAATMLLGFIIMGTIFILGLLIIGLYYFVRFGPEFVSGLFETIKNYLEDLEERSK